MSDSCEVRQGKEEEMPALAYIYRKAQWDVLGLTSQFEGRIAVNGTFVFITNAVTLYILEQELAIEFLPHHSS